MMKLAIVYHVYKNFTYLEQSLNSIFNQTDKNFEFILINDGASTKVNTILQKFDFNKLKKFTYYSWNQNVGHAATFNNAVKNTDVEYLHYAGSNFIFNRDFVKIVNMNIEKYNPDVISFNSIKNDYSVDKYEKLNIKFKLGLHYSTKDKIYRSKLLKDNNIYFNDKYYAPLIFIYQLIKASKKWIVIDGINAVYKQNNNYTYNLYDVFNQNDYLIQNYANDKIWKSHYDLFEYLLCIYVLRVFLFRMFNAHKEKAIRVRAINSASKWLSENIPNWRSNRILINPKNRRPVLTYSFTKLKLKIRPVAKLIKEMSI